MELVMLILVLLFVAFVGIGVYAGVKAVGAAKRGVDRTISQARRSVEDTTLRARSLGQLGVQGELAQLRLRLRTAMRATQDTLRAAAADDASLAESVSLFQRLTAHGRELDGELRQLERDPDRARITERLGELRERTERISQSADSLRWAARDRARKFAEDDLSSLSAQIDVESGALRHWATAGQDDRPVFGTEKPHDTAPGAEGPPPAGAAGPAGPEQAPSEAPQAIEPQDTRRWTGSPWQKQARPARPETTN